MGDEADRMEAEAQRDYDEFLFEWAQAAPPGVWRTRNGDLYSIRDMTLDHLTNAIDFCTRIGLDGAPKVDELRQEIRRRAKTKATRILARRKKRNKR